MTCRILRVVWCLVLGSSSLAAQQAALRPRPSSLFIPPAVATDSVKLAPTYWKEGALLVGIPLGVLGAYATYGFCQDTDSGGTNEQCGLKAVAGFLIVGAIGAIPGALIGGQFHKKE